MASNSLHDKAPNPLPTATYSSRLVQPRPPQPLQSHLQPSQSLLSHHFHSQLNLAETLVKAHTSQSTASTIDSHCIAVAAAAAAVANFTSTSCSSSNTNATAQRSGTADARCPRSDMLDSNNLQTTNLVPSFRNTSNVSIALAAQQQHQQQQQSQQQSLFAIGSQSSVANPGVAAAAAVTANNGIGISKGSNASNSSSNGSLSQSGPPSTLDLSEFPSLSGGLSAIGVSVNNSINSNSNFIVGNSNVNNGNNIGILNPIGSSNGSTSNASSIGSNSNRDGCNSQSLGGNNLIGSLGNVGSGRPYVGIIKDGSSTSVVASTAEFNIHSEDFPALSGSNLTAAGTSDSAVQEANHQIVGGSSIGGLFGQSSAVGTVAGSCSNIISSNNLNSQGVGQLTVNGLSTQSLESSSTNCDILKTNATQVGSQQTIVGLKQSVQANVASATTQQQQKRGVQTSKDGRVSNIPSGMITDQFGMVGLLTFIRVSESDPNLVSLALGTDLTTLKLDLNCPDTLFSTFPGPWSDIPLKPHEIDFPVPQEYLINNQIRDKLAPIKLGRYGDDTLFFLFYLFPNEVIQAAAANEL
jgi:hypothetical protein